MFFQLVVKSVVGRGSDIAASLFSREHNRIFFENAWVSQTTFMTRFCVDDADDVIDAQKILQNSFTKTISHRQDFLATDIFRKTFSSLLSSVSKMNCVVEKLSDVENVKLYILHCYDFFSRKTMWQVQRALTRMLVKNLSLRGEGHFCWLWTHCLTTRVIQLGLQP